MTVAASHSLTGVLAFLRDASAAAAGHVARRPEILLDLARGALAARLGVPLAAVRWLLEAHLHERGLRDVAIEALPPGFRLTATLEVMGARMRVAAVIHVEDLERTDDEILVPLRLSEVDVELLDAPPDSAVATLLRSGALDLRRPGNLIAFMPGRPSFIVAAADDRLVIDICRLPALVDPLRQRAARALLGLLGVARIESDHENLEFVLRPFARWPVLDRFS